MMKKLGSVLMALVMVLSLLPTTVLAADAATGTITPAFTASNRFWGEGASNSDESFVVELYQGDTKLASASLNNVDGIMDGDVYVTWSIPFDGQDSDYWDVEWTEGYPKYDMNPDAVKLFADGVQVATNDVQYNGPDNLNKIVALAQGNTGGVAAYTSLTEAMGKFNGRKVNVVRDVAESIDGFYGVTLSTNVPGGVTITDTNTEDWIDFDDVIVGEGVCVNICDAFSGDSENVILGTLKVDATYYHGYDAKTTIKDGGNVVVGGTTILRYNKDADSGIYIYGDGDDATVEFDCDYYIGAYSGTFYAEDASVECGYFLLKNSYDNSDYADIDMTLDRSKLTVVGTTDMQDSFIIDDQVKLTLTNGSAIKDVRDFNILAGTQLELYMDAASVVNATNVSIADGVAMSASKDETNNWSFKVQLNGAGTVDSPFVIRSLYELEAFRDEVNAGNSYAGKVVKLAADIDLGGKEWTPIGNASKPFNGNFDGDGHTIRNLVVNMPGKSDAGLFGRTNNGEIRNLTVENAKVTGRLNVGVVAGTPYTSKYTNISVVGHVEVNGMSYVGGVGGKNAYANWTDITVDVDEESYVKADSVENGTAYRTYVGGVIGFMGEGTHKFENITSNIDVIGNVKDVGGITGIAHEGNRFVNVTCTADVTNTAETADRAKETGGIAGTWMNQGRDVTFENCTFVGEISAPNVPDMVFPGGGLFGAGYNADTTNTMAEAEVLLNKTTYPSLTEALVDAQDGDTIELLRDIKLATKLYINKAVVIDGKGYAIVADETAVWYTTSGSLGIKNYKTHLLGLNSDGVTLKNLVLDNNHNAAGVNVYCAKGVVLDNISIVNATKGYAGLTVNGSTVTAKTALTIHGNTVAIDVDQGSGVIEIPGVTIKEGTVTDLDNKAVKFKSVAVMDLSGAVTAEGKPYFVAKDSAYYYSREQMRGRTAAYSNGLILLADVELDRDLILKGTLNLNGNTLTLVEGKAVKTSGNLTLAGEGTVDGGFVLAGAGHTLTAPEGLTVSTNVEGKWPIYSEGAYRLTDATARIDMKGYTTLDAAVKAVKKGQTIVLLADNDETVKIKRNVTFVLEKAGYDLAGDIVPATSTCTRTVVADGTALTYTFKVDTPLGGGGSIAPATYAVTMAKTENGSVTAKPSKAGKGDEVELIVAAAQGYELAEIAVVDAKGNAIAVTGQDGKYVFTMPAAKVTVTATFEESADVCPNCPAAKYTDLVADAWYHDGVHFCVEKGLMVGTGETTFAPAENLSRAMVVQMLYNYVGQPATNAENKFSDVKADVWYYNAVRWGADQDVVSGYGEGRFGPDDNVTIEQAVAILHNYAGRPAGTGDAAALGAHSTWANNALNWAEANGILSGMPHDALTETATRAQMAQMFMNYLRNEL